MLTSKQRAYLRAMANSIETILMVGKGGISDDIVKQANDALKARELLKEKCWRQRRILRAIQQKKLQKKQSLM